MANHQAYPGLPVPRAKERNKNGQVSDSGDDEQSTVHQNDRQVLLEEYFRRNRVVIVNVQSLVQHTDVALGVFIVNFLAHLTKRSRPTGLHLETVKVSAFCAELLAAATSGVQFRGCFFFVLASENVCVHARSWW
jgi:hypothetical protein